MPIQIKIDDIIVGCEAGRMQSVGPMQVVPILGEDADDTIATPDTANVSTSGYGTVVVENPTDHDMITPCHAGYVVEQAAQDHALPSTFLVKAKETRRFDNAMCIQETQGGYIRSGQHQLLILPYVLRTPALNKRGQRGYSKLWNDIRAFNTSFGVSGAGNLVLFLTKFKDQLDQFVAEFEMVPGQVGAIILVNGQIIGIERAPSNAYWQAIWQALIRECYGSYALYTSLMAGNNIVVPPTRARISGQAESLSELKEALKAAENAERDMAVKALGAMKNLLLTSTSDRGGSLGGRHIETLQSNAFVGQLVRNTRSKKAIYGSLIAPAG